MLDAALENDPGAAASPLTHHASRITHHVTVAGAVERFLGDLRQSPRTVATYRAGLNKFQAYLAAQGLDPAAELVTALTIDHVVGFVTDSAPRNPRALSCVQRSW